MENTNYCYYSKLLKQPYESLEELKAAEEKVLALEKAKDEKRELAQKVNDAYANYVEVSKQANQAVADARTEYEKIKSEFVKKYGSYHMTYTSPDGKETRSVSEVYSTNMFNTLNDFVDLVDRYLRG